MRTDESEIYEITQGTHEYPNPRIRLARPNVGGEELEAIAAVLKTGVLTNGPETEAFEHEFADLHQVEHGVAFANGTLALVAMLLALGIGPGDEVIVPSLTFVSSATSISLVGGTPVFAEVDPESFNLDPQDAAGRITARTKAIVAVHYGGQACDLSELKSVADEAGIFLLEDAAEAHGATYEGIPVGGFGEAAMFSFTPTKNITTGEGGLVLTHNGNLARQLRLLRNHGQTNLYHHDILGWNMRLTEMQAAMGRCQIRKLDQILERKQNAARTLTRLVDSIEGVTPPRIRSDRSHTFMLFTTRVTTSRDQVLHIMRSQGIESRIYFPPVHMQPIYAQYAQRLPITEMLATEILSLPVHASLTDGELAEIAQVMDQAVAACRE